jgi:hypothetical protein
MNMPDLEYMGDGILVAFMPKTPEGNAAWNELARMTDGTGKVFRVHLAATLQQLRAAGYVVRKARPSKASAPDDTALLAALLD